MRHILPLAVVVLAVTSGCHSPNRLRSELATSAATRRAVELAVTDSFFRAIERYDYAALRRAVTPAFELVEDTLRLTIEQFVGLVRSFEGKATVRYAFDGFTTRVAGPVAWTTYRNRGDFHIAGQRTEYEWLETAVLVERDGTWRIDRLQSTVVRPRS